DKNHCSCADVAMHHTLLFEGFRKGKLCLIRSNALLLKRFVPGRFYSEVKAAAQAGETGGRRRAVITRRKVAFLDHHLPDVRLATCVQNPASTRPFRHSNALVASSWKACHPGARSPLPPSH